MNKLICVLGSLSCVSVAFTTQIPVDSLLPFNSNVILTPELHTYQIHQAIPGATVKTSKEISMQTLGTFSSTSTDLPATLSLFNHTSQQVKKVRLSELDINITMLVPEMNNIGGTFRSIYTNSSDSESSVYEQAGQIYCVYKTPTVKTHKIQDKTGDGTLFATATEVVTTTSCILITTFTKIDSAGEYGDYRIPMNAPITLKYSTITTKNGPSIVESTSVFVSITTHSGGSTDIVRPKGSHRLYDNVMLSRISVLPGTTNN